MSETITGPRRPDGELPRWCGEPAVSVTEQVAEQLSAAAEAGSVGRMLDCGCDGEGGSWFRLDRDGQVVVVPVERAR